MKVVIAGPNGPDEEWDALKEAGHEVVFGQIDRNLGGRLSDGELIELCQGADVLVSLFVSPGGGGLA